MRVRNDRSAEKPASGVVDGRTHTGPATRVPSVPRGPRVPGAGDTRVSQIEPPQRRGSVKQSEPVVTNPVPETQRYQSRQCRQSCQPRIRDRRPLSQLKSLQPRQSSKVRHSTVRDPGTPPEVEPRQADPAVPEARAPSSNCARQVERQKPAEALGAALSASPLRAA